ncbi:MAG TPA: hypothetical protein PLC89_24760 [Haliscomenobacter sp.]|uniref:nSTAND1 domain-containing NTPase n=1 Tax=Haliscomenobacter sp. TaxID=2717303 RepID=UPI002CEA93FB|nr:hypothetical protein [Haliscomenobacter sp.]HOY20545.1 hypothetical protein [Haliscomenobacter sp.]HPH20533.1 hypothetical protein [Haliscomenobacter sp.]
MATQYRYPGARPFEMNQKPLFFGRENDIEDLYRLIGLEPLVVVYSKSGLGKSSLLNAGIMPKAIEKGRYDTLRVRFNAWQKGRKYTPLQIAQDSIADLCPRFPFLAKLCQGDTSLWRLIKDHQFHSNGTKGLLLVFDQFEELFTFPKEAIANFRRELAEALYSTMPEPYVDALEQQLALGELDATAEELNLLQTPPQLRVVMAIRSDRMHLLDQLSDYLPNILKKCYELTPLNSIQAEAAIRKPAKEVAPELSTPPFEYEQEALDNMLDFLTKQGQQRIESFQLQILCQSVEKKVQRAGQRIQASDLGDVESVYENYYEDQLELLTQPAERHAARILIEEGLVFEEEERRISLYEGQIYRNYQLSPEALRLLVDSHLLRSEPSMQGEGYTYELSHDTLVGPVLRAKARRKEAENQRRETEERQRREQELADIRQKAEAERQRAEEERQLRERAEAAQQEAETQRGLAEKRQRRAALFTLMSIGLAVVSIVFFLNAQSNAQTAKKNALEATKNLEQMRLERAGKDRRDYDLLLQRGDDLLETEYPAAARELYEKAKTLVNDNADAPVFAGKLAEIEARIQQTDTDHQ